MVRKPGVTSKFKGIKGEVIRLLYPRKYDKFNEIPKEVANYVGRSYHYKGEITRVQIPQKVPTMTYTEDFSAKYSNNIIKMNIRERHIV